MKCTPAFEKRMQRIIGAIFCYGVCTVAAVAFAVLIISDPGFRHTMLIIVGGVLAALLVCVSVLWCLGDINFCKDDKTG